MKSFKTFFIESSQQTQCDINGICKVIKQYESGGNEDKILSVYQDSKGLDTIGHGHLITPESKAIFNDVFAEENKKDPNFVQNILSGSGKLTSEQADRLLMRDVNARIPKLQKMVPNFNNFTPELQGQLASEQFRGMLGKSPTAIKKLNSGDFEGAADEYLNAKDYRNSVRDKTGIAGRMKNLSDAIRTEPLRQKQRRSPSQTTQAPESPSISQTAPSP